MEEKEKYEEEFLRFKEISEKLKEKIEKGKKAVESFKEKILQKYNFISSISMAFPIANKIIEENMEEEEREKFEKEKKEEVFHVFLIIPDEKVKEIPDLTVNAINLVKNEKPKLWLHFLTPQLIWQSCFDAKYEYVEAIAMSLPIHDTGILGALRVANIHKILTIGKFERYVVSYVLAGSIVRGQATTTSDVDVFIVIDDTDVKRMSRIELKERLTSIIFGYAIEANERANAKNKLSPQVYLLTEFWEAVKEAHPVIFTFIRDGVPLYDRGAFMPWKLLLKMGKIKPSPEAIEMFMSLGEKVVENVKRKLNSLVAEDIYWGIITPTQAALMLYGIPPPTPKETVSLVEEIFVKKENLLEKRYVDILRKIVDIYKKFEHEEIKEIKGKDIDFILEEIKEYMERLKKLTQVLTEKAINKAVEDLEDNLKKILNQIYGKKSIKECVALLKKDFVDKGYVSRVYFENLKKFLKIKKAKKKIEMKEFESIRRDVLEILKFLKEFSERKEMLEKTRGVLRIKYREDGKIFDGEVIIRDKIFLIPKIFENRVEKFDDEKRIFVPSSEEELSQSLKEVPKEIKLKKELVEVLEKRFKDLEIIL
jgi:predicted nucleotidyltransferase/uncharacterized protein (UPF0332 family)